MDSSRPLLIDTARNTSTRTIRAYLLVTLGALLFACLYAPKDHIADYSIYRLSHHSFRAPHSFGEPHSYNFHFSQLSAKTAPVILSVFGLRLFTKFHEIFNMSVVVDWGATRNGEFLAPAQPESSTIFLEYQHHSRQSNPAPLLQIPVRHADSVSVNVTLNYSAGMIAALVFEWSMKNPSNPPTERVARYGFLFFAGILTLLLAQNLCWRLEQCFSLVYFILYIISSQNLISHCKIFQIVEKIMLSYVESFLFYIIAFIANKHRNFVTQLGFLLILLSLISELGCCFESSKLMSQIMCSHNVGVHACLVAVVESMIAAMYFSADDRSAFIVYTFALSLCFGSILLIRDWVFVSPYIEHMAEMQIAFYGIHAIIIAFLFYYHQGVKGSESEGDRLSDDPSDPALFV
jgi:hypothetical protein